MGEVGTGRATPRDGSFDHNLLGFGEFLVELFYLLHLVQPLHGGEPSACRLGPNLPLDFFDLGHSEVGGVRS